MRYRTLHGCGPSERRYMTLQRYVTMQPWHRLHPEKLLHLPHGVWPGVSGQASPSEPFRPLSYVFCNCLSRTE